MDLQVKGFRMGLTPSNYYGLWTQFSAIYLFSKTVYTRGSEIERWIAIYANTCRANGNRERNSRVLEQQQTEGDISNCRNSFHTLMNFVQQQIPENNLASRLAILSVEPNRNNLIFRTFHVLQCFDHNRTIIKFHTVI